MYIIRLATKDDSEGKGIVHYQSWNETYTGLINQDYLDKRSLDKCIDIARKYQDNTFVSELDGKIVGFACYSKYRGNDLENASEVTAIYVLKEFQGLNIGRSLMDACIEKLSEFSKVVIWVLSSNVNAINFYKHYGFVLDGKSKDVKFSETTTINEVRMIKELID